MPHAQERPLQRARNGVTHLAIASVLASSCALLLLSTPVRAADPEWLEVRSPHFRVLTDGSEKEGREVAREFERMRSMFSRILPNLKLESGKPLLIVAPNDEGSAKRLLPKRWSRKGAKAAGIFRYGWERDYAMLRLDDVHRASRTQIAGSGYHAVYDQYTRSLLYSSFRWLPAWVDAGLSEFFANTRFEQGEIRVGALSTRVTSVQNSSIIPVEQLINISWSSPEYRDSSMRSAFNSEAWTLVHLLMTKPNQSGKGFARFLSLVNAGMKQEDAFQQAIGEFNEVQIELGQYLRHRSVPSLVYPDPTPVDMSTFVSRRLSPAETAAELATFELWMEESEAARLQAELALKLNPQSATAHETLGFVHFVGGNDAEATKEFDLALQIDNSLYLAEYYRTMLSPIAEAQSPEDINALRTRLVRVLELNPNFAPAYVELAVLDLRQGSVTTALVHARQALGLSPTRADYYTLVAEILHALGSDDEAAFLARFVAERWLGLHLDEAVKLWEELPQSARTGNPLTPTGPTAGMRTITGKITSLTCDDKGESMTIALDGTPVALKIPEKIVTVFSDTLWYGGDHFSFCHHLEGFQGLVDYDPSSNPGIPVRFYVRREIPVPTNSR